MFNIFLKQLNHFTFHQQWMRVVISPYPCQHLLLSFIFYFSHPNGCEVTLTNDVKHLFMGLLAICLFSLEKGLLKSSLGTSLVAWWLRIHLPMQGTRVRSLFWEDPTCHGATKSSSHNYWDHMPQLLKHTCLEPMLHNKRSYCNEKPAHRNKE